MAALLLARRFVDQALRLEGEPARLIPPLQAGQIILLDTIGELASVYSLAAVAFVGGSLIPPAATTRLSLPSSVCPS